MSWWQYLLLVNFYLVLFFGFYALLLRKETFFQLNRIYLVAAATLSFVIPLIQADWVKNLFITQQVQQKIYNTPVNIYTYNFTPASNLLTIGEVLSILYVSVAAILVLKLAWELVVLKREIEKPDPSVAYSFFKKISLGNNTANHNVIAEHEQVHARQWHTIDVLIIESIVIINWFNPVVYLYRFAIKYIHEFIADSQVLQAGTDKADYALLLLTQTFDVPSHHLVSNFYNHSLLKQRILMLQKNKSRRIALAKYGLSAPLFILMMILSSATVNNSRALKKITTQAQDVLLAPASPSAAMLNGREDELVKFPPPLVFLSDTTGYMQAPSFPGGSMEFHKFLSGKVIYPAIDRENNVQGKVMLQFFVETDGSITDIKAASGPSKTLMEAAVLAMKDSPKWIPGYKAGKLEKMLYTSEVNFTLGEGESDSRVYDVVEVMPAFPGGVKMFGQYLNQNLKYPDEDRKNKVQGKVYAQFVVEADGSLSNIRAVRSPSVAMAEEAVRVLSASPKWKPGIQNGRAVRAEYTVPINFLLDDTTPLAGLNLQGINAFPTGNLPANPLIIIDGVENNKNIKDVDPRTILSVSILKEPAATAKYGTKGANGVLLISTTGPKAPQEDPATIRARELIDLLNKIKQ